MKTHFFKTTNIYIFHFYRCFLNTKQKILTHDQKLKQRSITKYLN